MFMLCAAVGWSKALDPLFYISRVGATLELVLNIVWSALHIVLMAHSVLSHTNKEQHVCVQALPPPAFVLSKAFLVKNSTVQVELSAVEITLKLTRIVSTRVYVLSLASWGTLSETQ